jgi:hypothetical protein
MGAGDIWKFGEEFVKEISEMENNWIQTLNI